METPRHNVPLLASASRNNLTHLAFFLVCLLIPLFTPMLHGDSPAHGAKVSPPATFLWSGESLAAAKAAYLAGDARATADVRAIVKEAEAELTRAPLSVVTAGGPLAASGDPHDYFSTGPYWWPNPDTADGLPYVRRDGQVNRETFEGRRKALSLTIAAVRRLSLAWYFSGDERYAAHAVAVLRTWFIAPEARMNPNLRYAQAVPGVNDGRPIGIIDAAGLLELIDGIQILKTGGGTSALTAADQSALQAWFSDFLTWFLDSEVGKAAGEEKNNIGTWYYAQIGAYAAFAGRESAVRSIYEQRLPALIRQQIIPDGRQPHELARTRPMGYSAFNLMAWESIAILARRMGLDYWSPDTPVGDRLHAALRYLAAYAPPSSDWPYPEINSTPQRDQLVPLFLRTRALSGWRPDPLIDGAIQQLAPIRSASWTRLVYGHQPQ